MSLALLLFPHLASSWCILSVALHITIRDAVSIRDLAVEGKQPARSTTCWICIAAVDFYRIASAVCVTGSLASHEVHVVSYLLPSTVATRTPVEKKRVTTFLICWIACLANAAPIDEIAFLLRFLRTNLRRML